MRNIIVAVSFLLKKDITVEYIKEDLLLRRSKDDELAKKNWAKEVEKIIASASDYRQNTDVGKIERCLHNSGIRTNLNPHEMISYAIVADNLTNAKVYESTKRKTTEKNIIRSAALRMHDVGIQDVATLSKIIEDIIEKKNRSHRAHKPKAVNPPHRRINPELLPSEEDLEEIEENPND